MYTKIIILLGLLIPAMAMAERPAMSDRYEEPEQAQPMAIESAESEAPAAEPAVVEEVVIQQVSGDVIEIQAGETIIINPLDFPRRGMSMDKVQNELGRPLEISPTVGEPPITAWTYADRVVFFEHSKVIHAVERR
ncbi:MAG: hypothetical protein JSW45_02885 [Thiotrichales bacterium]|nr:MAG: hypothetical protein JSW45_02885 [Thiotrichales bacterium]